LIGICGHHTAGGRFRDLGDGALVRVEANGIVGLIALHVVFVSEIEGEAIHDAPVVREQPVFKRAFAPGFRALFAPEELAMARGVGSPRDDR